MWVRNESLHIFLYFFKKRMSENIIKSIRNFCLSIVNLPICPNFSRSVAINPSTSKPLEDRRAKRSVPSANRERQSCMKDSSQSLSTLHKGLISFCSLSLASRLLSTHLSAWLLSRILLSRYLTRCSTGSVRRLWFLSFINPRSLCADWQQWVEPWSALRRKIVKDSGGRQEGGIE